MMPMAAPRGSSGLAKATLGVLGLRLLYLVFNMVAGPSITRAIIQSSGYRALQSYFLVQQGIQSLLVLAAVIMFSLFLRSEIIALRAGGHLTKYTPGWAIGWWFVPFANFVMPLLVLLDVWKRRLPNASGALPGLWWAGYMFMTIWNMAISNIHTRMPAPVYYLTPVVVLGTFGLWAVITFMLMGAPATSASNAPGQFTAPPTYGNQPPGGYGYPGA